MGFYTHGWAESHGGIHDVGREASQPIEAEMAVRAKADRESMRRERIRAESHASVAGPAGGRTAGKRDYGEAVVQTGATLLGQTPVPDVVVRGFLGVIRSIFTLDFH